MATESDFHEGIGQAWFQQHCTFPSHNLASFTADDSGADSDCEDKWVCPICNKVDHYEAFEAGLCDDCFLTKMHEWAVAEKVQLNVSCGANCNIETCPCNWQHGDDNKNLLCK